jgi:hypothetical protein
MISRSDWEPLPTPTLSPFALARQGTFLRVGFFTAAVWCVPALRVPLVHSLINSLTSGKKMFKGQASYNKLASVRLLGSRVDTQLFDALLLV